MVNWEQGGVESGGRVGCLMLLAGRVEGYNELRR